MLWYMDAVFDELLKYEEYRDFVVGIYVKYYSDAEISQLVDFYKSPVGVKSLKVMPQIAADSMGYMMPTINERMPKILKRFEQDAKSIKECGAK